MIMILLPLIVAKKRALRCVFNVPRNTRTAPLYKKHKVLTLNQMYKLQALLFVYKFKMSLLPVVFINFYRKHSEIHNYLTRQIDNYYLPNFKYDITRTSIRYVGCKLWNELDIDTKSLTIPLGKFKKHIFKKWFPE